MDLEIYLLCHLKLNVLKCSCSLHQFGQMLAIIIVLTHKVELAFLTPLPNVLDSRKNKFNLGTLRAQLSPTSSSAAITILIFFFFALFHHHQISIRCAQLSPTSFSTILILFAPSPPLVWVFDFLVLLGQSRTMAGKA